MSLLAGHDDHEPCDERADLGDDLHRVVDERDRDREEEPEEHLQPVVLGLGRRERQPYGVCRLLRAAERRVLVGQQADIGVDEGRVAAEAGDEVEHPARPPGREQQHEPGHDHHERRGDCPQRQHHVVRDRQDEPEERRQPASPLDVVLLEDHRERVHWRIFPQPSDGR